ncbi:hypothetical protein PSI19_08055 [Xenorhabdus khoisanae]|nr:hypothetical protein [Xenorhabdus khoisanae]
MKVDKYAKETRQAVDRKTTLPADSLRQAAFWLMTTVDDAIGKKGMESNFDGAENLDLLTYMMRKTFTS